MTMQEIYKSTRQKNREIRNMVADQSAITSIGKLEPGFNIFCLNKGQFSIINVIEAMLLQTGTADVIISTWTAADAEISKAFSFLQNERINNLHWIVDRSFPTRQKKYYDTLVSKFGLDSVSMTNSHAKFILISNNDWKIVIRTSMNLNENKRLEFWEASDDKDLFEYMLLISEQLIDFKTDYRKFEFVGKGKQFEKYLTKNQEQTTEFELEGFNF
jgi:hypothetical protein